MTDLPGGLQAYFPIDETLPTLVSAAYRAQIGSREEPVIRQQWQMARVAAWQLAASRVGIETAFTDKVARADADGLRAIWDELSPDRMRPLIAQRIHGVLMEQRPSSSGALLSRTGLLTREGEAAFWPSLAIRVEDRRRASMALTRQFCFMATSGQSLLLPQVRLTARQGGTVVLYPTEVASLA